MKSSFYSIKGWYKAIKYYLDKDENGITYIRPEAVKYLKIKNFGDKRIDDLSTELKEMMLRFEEHLRKNEPQSYAVNKDADNIIAISNFLLQTAFERMDERCLASIINDMLKIGTLVEDKTFNEILAYDNWDSEEDIILKSDIENKILSFASKYGLLGILNNTLSGLSDSYRSLRNMDIIGSMDITSFVSQLYMDFIWNKVEKTIRQPPNYPLSMPVNEYIKVFFPDIPSNILKYMDEYFMMDNRYFAYYSEPIYLFLLAATYLHRIFPIISNRFKSNSLYNQKANTSYVDEINVRYTYEYDSNSNVYKTILNFSSLYDIVCYYLVRSLLEGRQNTIVCRHCNAMGIALNKRSEFCSPECQNRAKAKRHRKKVKYESQKKSANIDGSDF